LTDILGFNFEQSKKKFIASTEICKKCLRAVCDIVKVEEQVKRQKEDLVSNFFSTTSKFNKNQGSQLEETKPASSPQVPSVSQMTHDHQLSPTSTFQERKGFNTTPTQNGYTHPFLLKSVPQPVAFLNQPKPIQYGNGLVQFYRANYPDYQKAQIDAGSNSMPCSPAERRENPNYREGSDYAGSEVGSSCYLSISPPPKEKNYIPTNQDLETDSQAGSVSPRPFDTQSYASTFSFRSNNSSIRSKAEVKSYGATTNGPQNCSDADRITEEAECKKLNDAERFADKTDTFSRAIEKSSYESNEGSPMSQESRRSPGTSSSESFESITPNATSPTPEDDLVTEEERAERRKPWKKRKRVQEREHENSSPEKVTKMEDSNESPDCQDQLDASTSDQN